MNIADVFKEAHEVPPAFVYFIPLDETESALFIPVLPTLVIYNDDGYKNFLADFRKVYVDLPEDREDPVGRIWIEHKGIAYTFHALESFIQAMESSRHVILVPYCAEEGVPRMDVFGAKLSVVKKPTLLEMP